MNEWQEEMALHWVQSLGSEFHQNEHFKKNFSEEFLGSFKNSKNLFGLAEGQEIDFDQIDFREIHQLKEERKLINAERKPENKLKNE